jgi:hypothetical protein
MDLIAVSFTIFMFKSTDIYPTSFQLNDKGRKKITGTFE